MSSKYCCTRQSCVYHPHRGPDKGTCDYLSITGHRRGCPIVGCDKYTPGKRKNHTVKGVVIEPDQPRRKPGRRTVTAEEKEAYAKWLNSLLKKRNMQQAELGRRIGVDPQSVNGYCKGRAIPRPERQKKIRQVLGVEEEE